MDANGEATLNRVFVFALFTPATCFLLHWSFSGGLVGSHLAVANALSLLQCCASLIVFLLMPTGDAPRKILMLLGMMLASTMILHTTAILFGAAVISQFWESLSWSLLTSSLSVLPAMLLLRDDLGVWTRVFLQNRFSNSSEWSAWLICVATLVGAWLGALPIPLDWNRPWQVWPVPCSIGALVGNEAGLLASIAVHHLYFRRTRTRRCV